MNDDTAPYRKKLMKTVRVSVECQARLKFHRTVDVRVPADATCEEVQDFLDQWYEENDSVHHFVGEPHIVIDNAVIDDLEAWDQGADRIEEIEGYPRTRFRMNWDEEGSLYLDWLD